MNILVSILTQITKQNIKNKKRTIRIVASEFARKFTLI